MRIVIDMQGAQSEGSANRGIGRYARALAQGMIEAAPQHDIHLLVNGLLGKTTDELRSRFAPLIGQDHVHSWYPRTSAATSVDDFDEQSELLFQAAVARLQPDVLLITSLFETPNTGVANGIEHLADVLPVAVVAYDLIPYLFADIYLRTDAEKRWYANRLRHLKSASSLLSISEATRSDLIEHLDIAPDDVTNISTASTSDFGKKSYPKSTKKATLHGLGIESPFIMYTGGIDHRKNIDQLIKSYSLLDLEVRSSHQLVIVCAVSAAVRHDLLRTAENNGIDASRLVLTGFIPDNDLDVLYRECALFVFPSWYEGFGLPALEAMQCGAPVIASDRSSLPEVVGQADALFDPFSAEDIAGKMMRALTDESWRQRLIRNAKRRSAKFSWERTARATIEALERCCDDQSSLAGPSWTANKKLAYVSPLPPLPSGIGTYSVALVECLARFYEIDIIIDQPGTIEITGVQNVHNIEHFSNNIDQYDRVIYNIGNSEFHAKMLPLMSYAPGVVIHHDIFISGLVDWINNNIQEGYYLRSLYDSHGYVALQHDARASNRLENLMTYPISRAIYDDAFAVFVHSAHARDLITQYYGTSSEQYVTKIPHPRSVPDLAPQTEARRRLHLNEQETVVCSFGYVGPSKQPLRLIEAWQKRSNRGPDARLVFVGTVEDSDTGRKVRAAADRDPTIQVTGWMDDATYAAYLAAADVAVQLRQDSRGETSGAALDTMAAGIATIVTSEGSMGELPDDAVLKVPSRGSAEAITTQLDRLLGDAGLRDRLGRVGRDLVARDYDPETVTTKIVSRIEAAYTRGPGFGLRFYRDAVRDYHDDPTVWSDLVWRTTRTLDRRVGPRQLLVDVTELNCAEFTSGVQRVVSEVLRDLFRAPPKGYRIEPVRADEAGNYRYARSFAARFLDVDVPLPDDLIDYAAGDHLLGIDFSLQTPPRRDTLVAMRRHGVTITQIIHDLIPLTNPDVFPENAYVLYTDWLYDVAFEANRLLCTSHATANVLEDRLRDHEGGTIAPGIATFRLGASTPPGADERTPSEGVFSILHDAPTVLVLSTVEPRKRHAQILDGFDLLWERGVDVNLIFVGREGWLVEEIMKRIGSHRERTNRFLHVADASDADVEDAFEAADLLLNGSIAEGFGLPIVEAALRGVPLLLRDIPVFREVAGEQAMYFSGDDGAAVADAVMAWLERRERGDVPDPTKVWVPSWTETTDQILSVMGLER